MKRDISNLIYLSFITIISVSIVFLSKKVKTTENIKNLFYYIKNKFKCKKLTFNSIFFIPYLKNNDKIEQELGI